MWTIGDIEILTDQRRVLVSSKPFNLGSRAFDLLELLASANGALVTKDQIMRHIWPDTIVVENNVHVQISAIRKLLARQSNRLVVVPGRGYRLTVDSVAPRPVSTGAVADTGTHPVSAVGHSNLPLAGAPIFGRDQAIRDVVNLCGESVLVNLVGAGGIGKTTLAVEAAHRLSASFTDGVWMVELSRVTAPQFVAGAIAGALGCQAASGGTALQRVLASLQGKRALIVLDNCEHLIHAAADAAYAILSSAPSCAIMATSREPLRVPGEIVYKVPALDVPLTTEGSEQDAAQTSAVQMFLSRARAIDRRFGDGPESIALAGEICGRLDGIPLAIELAASRAATLGIQELAENLDDRFNLLTCGYRTAIPQHQTLRATFDWSYSLLSANEQKVLRRLGVFPAEFGLEAAISVVCAEDINEADLVDAICALSEKSLLVAENSGEAMTYRLLETSRAYALQKLSDNGEVQTFEQRFIEFVRRRLQQTLRTARTYSDDEALTDFKSQLDDVRAALYLSFSSVRPRMQGSELLATAAPFFFALGLCAEVHEYARSALTIWPDKRAPESTPEHGEGLVNTVLADHPPSHPANAERQYSRDDAHRVWRQPAGDHANAF